MKKFKQQKLTNFVKAVPDENTSKEPIVQDSIVDSINASSHALISADVEISKSAESAINATFSIQDHSRNVRAPSDLTPVNEINRTVTANSLKGVKFPKSSTSKYSRNFNPTWLDKFKWLEYSKSRDAAFCFPCRAFDLTGMKEPTFTSAGFSTWKKALNTDGGFYKHEKSISHIEAMCSWEEGIQRHNDHNDVTEILCNTVLAKRRFYMKSIIEVLIFLIENEIAMRGNWDIENHKEDGIFRNLFEFKLQDSEQLRKCQEHMPKNATYLSPDIQNELIAIMYKLTQESIVRDIKLADVPWYSILVDGTKDRRSSECISTSIRYISEGQPKERLLSFETAKAFDANTNAEIILKTLKDNCLDSALILSQCFDGANVMSGDNGGVQRIIQKLLGRIIPYIHCVNHRLHLVVIKAIASIDIVCFFFENAKLVYNFFRRSKIVAIFEGTSILNVITTRWAGHQRAVNSIFENYDEIIYTLDQSEFDKKSGVYERKLGSKAINTKIDSINTVEVKINTKYNFDADDVALATGIRKTLQKKEFLFLLSFMKEFLNLIAPADKILQSRDVGFREAMPVIQEVVNNIRNLRNESTFDRIWESSEKQFNATKNITSETRPTRNKTRSASLAGFIVTEKIGERNTDIKIELKSAFFSVIDIFLQEMKNRFEDNFDILTAISESSEFCLEKLMPLKKIGVELPSEEELLVAKSYNERKQKIHAEECEKTGDMSYKNRFHLLKELFLVKEAFPKVYKLFATIDTFPCGTAICECSFSTLERVGSKKRINMDNQRLRHLSFLAFEAKTLSKIPIDQILRVFNDNPKRKIQLY